MNKDFITLIFRLINIAITLVSLPKQSVLQRGWKFISDCASAAVHDVVQQVSPLQVQELQALARGYFRKDDKQDHVSLENGGEGKEEQAVPHQMNFDVESLHPRVLEDARSSKQPAMGSSNTGKNECEESRRDASGGNEKPSAGTLSAFSKGANGDSEKPPAESNKSGRGSTEDHDCPPAAKSPATEKAAAEGSKNAGHSAPAGSESQAAVTPPPVRGATSHSTRSGRSLKRPPRFEEDEEEAVAAAADTTRNDQKRPRSRSGHCYTEAQVLYRQSFPSVSSRCLSRCLTLRLLSSD